MNGMMKLKIEQGIQKVMDQHCENSDVWPEFVCPPELAVKMADAAEVVFDLSVLTSQYQKAEQL